MEKKQTALEQRFIDGFVERSAGPEPDRQEPFVFDEDDRIHHVDDVRGIEEFSTDVAYYDDWAAGTATHWMATAKRARAAAEYLVLLYHDGVLNDEQFGSWWGKDYETFRRSLYFKLALRDGADVE